MIEFYIINNKPEFEFEGGFENILQDLENANYSLRLSKALDKNHGNKKIYKVSGDLKFEEVK